MVMKKLKTATGVIGLIAVLATLFYAFFALPYAANNVPEGGSLPLLFMALYFVLVIIAFCILAVIQLVFSLIYVFAKPKGRAFYITGCVFSAFDILNIILIIFVAFIVADVVVGGIFPLIAALVTLPIAANTALRIACAAKFKQEIKTDKNNSEEE